MIRKLLAGAAAAVMAISMAVAQPLGDTLRQAERGDASAQFTLGLKYYNGESVPQDPAEAARWFRNAAEQGNADAQNNLGVMYVNGEGVPQDDVLAHMWVNLSAAQGIQYAQRNLDAIARRMTPDQIAEAQRMAREWKPSSR